MSSLIHWLKRDWMILFCFLFTFGYFEQVFAKEAAPVSKRFPASIPGLQLDKNTSQAFDPEWGKKLGFSMMTSKKRESVRILFFDVKGLDAPVENSGDVSDSFRRRVWLRN